MEKINEQKETNQKKLKFLNYNCIKCGELPLLHFSNFDLDIICSKHKILNISIEKFYNYISFDYQCFICKEFTRENNYFYCYECNNYYCNICKNKHMEELKNSNLIINSNEKNIICQSHNKKYDKYCFKCKINLCELCENHNNHYVELFKDIYPSEQDINNFYELMHKILYNLEENEQNEEKEFNLEFSDNSNSSIEEIEEGTEIDINKNEKKKLRNERLKKCIEIKSLFIESFSKKISNYNYINNINNIIRCTCLIKKTNFNANEIKYIDNIDSKKDSNNIENKILIKSLIINSNLNFCSSWCMKQLNIIKIAQIKIELIAIGIYNEINLLNLLNFQIYQVIKEHESTVYSLDQYKDDPTFLFSSSEDRTINIYKLDNNYKYKLIQKLRKKDDKSGGEINKVIILSNKLLVSSDHRSITIWKSKEKENNNKYEDFHEIVIDLDTCHLLEVNPSIFVATQYKDEGNFQVYKNDGQSFPLIGELKNTKSHGKSSNGLSKINNNIVCSASDDLFYLINIEPLQVIQKIVLNCKIDIYFMYTTKDNYLYFNFNNYISQYKIKNDENNNFQELIEIGKFSQEDNYEGNYILNKKSIVPLQDGRIIFMVEKKGNYQFQLIC